MFDGNRRTVIIGIVGALALVGCGSADDTDSLSEVAASQGSSTKPDPQPEVSLSGTGSSDDSAGGDSPSEVPVGPDDSTTGPGPQPEESRSEEGDGRPPGWPIRNPSRTTTPEAIDVPDVAGISNPVTGGGVTVQVMYAEAQRDNELQGSLNLTVRVTNNSLTGSISAYGILDSWCVYPSLSLSIYSSEILDQTEIEPLESREFGPLRINLNLPLSDCNPVVALELDEAPPGSDTDATVRDENGVLSLVLPIDLASLLDAVPIPSDTPSILELCLRVEQVLPELFPGELLVRDPSVACEWKREAGGVSAVSVRLNAGVPRQPQDQVPTSYLSVDLGDGVYETTYEGRYSFVQLFTESYTLQVGADGVNDEDTTGRQLARTLFRLVTAPSSYG